MSKVPVITAGDEKHADKIEDRAYRPVSESRAGIERAEREQMDEDKSNLSLWSNRFEAVLHGELSIDKDVL